MARYADIRLFIMEEVSLAGCMEYTIIPRKASKVGSILEIRTRKGMLCLSCAIFTKHIGSIDNQELKKGISLIKKTLV